MFSQDPSHRRNAGRLAADHVLNALVKNAVNEHSREHGSDGDGPVPVALRAIAGFLVQHQRATYKLVASFVDAVWDVLTVETLLGKQTGTVHVVQARHGRFQQARLPPTTALTRGRASWTSRRGICGASGRRGRSWPTCCSRTALASRRVERRRFSKPTSRPCWR